MYHGGIPDPKKVGFFSLNSIGHGSDFTEDIKSLCDILQRQSYSVDSKGYEHEIIAASVDAQHQRYAWVEYRSKDLGRHVDVSFTLYARVNANPAIEWEVETYNPFFGCQVEVLHWADQHLLLIYHEKHDTYVCTFDVQPLHASHRVIKKPTSRHEIADEWLVKEGVLIYRSEEVDTVERMALPDLRPLEPWTADYARSIEALPPDYDEVNEIHRRHQKVKQEQLAANTQQPKWWQFWR